MKNTDIEKSQTVSIKSISTSNEKEENREYLKNDVSGIKFWNFSKKLFRIAIPAMFFYLFLFLLETINLAFIGNKYNNGDMIKGMGVSHMYLNFTMFSVIMGIVGGVETLCSNAFGIKDYKLMGHYLNRAKISGYILSLLIVCINYFISDKVLMMFNLNEKALYYALRYIRFCYIYIFIDVQIASNLRFINVIKKARVNFIIQLFGTALHPLWNYIFIVLLDLDVFGSGISYVITRLIISLLSTLYLKFYNPIPESYFSFSLTCFKGLGAYFKFALASSFISCGEWWATELQNVIVINIGEVDYTVHIISTQIYSLLFSMNFGFSIACSIIVGKYVTKYNAKKLNLVVIYTFLISKLFSLIVILILSSFGNKLHGLFLENSNVIEIGKKIVPLLFIYQFFSIGQHVLSSSLSALRKQLISTILSFIQFYVIMISLSYFFGIYLQMGVYGVWLGINVGQFSASALYLIVYLNLDLEKIKSQIMNSLNEDKLSNIVIKEQIEIKNMLERF